MKIKKKKRCDFCLMYLLLMLSSSELCFDEYSSKPRSCDGAKILISGTTLVRRLHTKNLILYIKVTQQFLQKISRILTFLLLINQNKQGFLVDFLLSKSNITNQLVYIYPTIPFTLN